MPSEHEHHEQHEYSEQHEVEHSNAPRSRTSALYILNHNTVSAEVILPGNAGRKTLTTGVWYSSIASGTYTVVAPGTPDVVYFKVHYVHNGNMSMEKGPLNGNFAVQIQMK